MASFIDGFSFTQCFSVHSHPDPSMAGFAGNNGYLYVSQKAKIIPPTKKEMEGPPKSDEDEENDDT